MPSLRRADSSPVEGGGELAAVGAFRGASKLGAGASRDSGEFGGGGVLKKEASFARIPSFGQRLLQAVTGGAIGTPQPGVDLLTEVPAGDPRRNAVVAPLLDEAVEAAERKISVAALDLAVRSRPRGSVARRSSEYGIPC